MNHFSPTYNSASVPSFCVGNPLSEALPSLPLNAELAEALVRRPRGDFSTSEHGTQTGFFEVSSLLDINYPRPESRIVAMRTFSMIHNTYSRMRPLTSEFVKDINEIDKEVFELNERMDFQCDAMTLLAWSGMGKTTLFDSISTLLPRVIEHTSYKGKPFFVKQVVWLSVDAPVNGSPKGFMLNIAQALDRVLGLRGPARYYQQMFKLSAESMKVHVARALRSHCVGLLHVDDVQRWGEADEKSKLMSVAMLVGLANTIGCALLLSGTPAALKVLQSNFEASRRANRRPAVVLMAPENENDLFFVGLVQYLFKFQATGTPIVPTPDICRTLLELTAGIPGVLNSLYVATQEAALELGVPLSSELFRQVMQADFGMLTSSVKKLRAMRLKGRNDWDPNIDKVLRDHLSNSSKKK